MMRLPTPKGTAHPAARFDPEALAEVRKSLAAGRKPGEIARERGVSESTVYRIQKRTSYRDE